MVEWDLCRKPGQTTDEVTILDKKSDMRAVANNHSGQKYSNYSDVTSSTTTPSPSEALLKENSDGMKRNCKLSNRIIAGTDYEAINMDGPKIRVRALKSMTSASANAKRK